MDLGTLIKNKRKECGLTIKNVLEQLANYNVKVSDKTLYGWENGYRQPDADTFLILCKIYGIHTLSDIETGEPDIVYSFKEQQHLKKYRRLNDNGKDRLDSYMDDLLTIDKYKASSPKPILLAGAARTNDGDYSKREEPTTEEEQKAMLKRLQEAHDEAEDNIY